MKHGDRSGGRRPRLYRIWMGMKQRCYYPKHAHFYNYGGAEPPIAVCEEWRTSYAAFKTWAESHGYSEELTLERKDRTGNYTPENCEWATLSKQNKNRHRHAPGRDAGGRFAKSD